VFDPWGDRLTGGAPAEPQIVSLDVRRVAEIRARFPFLRDRCI
jgi:hypothetical protein